MIRVLGHLWADNWVKVENLIGTFGELSLRAHRIDVKVSVVIINGLEDVIRSKEAAEHPKDLHVLPLLARRLQQCGGQEGW